MLLKATDIRKTYNLAASSFDVLKGIDLQIDNGEFVSIVGPSGAGKSTLLHILGCLDKPSAGVVIVDNEDIYKLTDIQRAKIRNNKIGFVFQFYHLLGEFTALENVMLPLIVKENRQVNNKLKEKGRELLALVGLEKRIEHKPNQLSGGEQQRVAIARALINGPQLILCDEPTGNLDSESGKNVIDLLFQLNQKNNQAVVVVTHDDDIAKISPKVIYMRDGKLI
ncbi:MAG: lipoprotein ABC transporter ATP-binding protein [Omnitrophica WOR_2 bacterium GWF2_38_59]|nr:MAG: lipoprotein ABC transporter ATP-binding protein [Omnitrophica WOR_2 bacterium GWA2_37_7]OGX22925.1 MAG: lipoprotein ABC transporter ATP-binding protein [Omnitrophica WOR_2 bacterium GWF2_38_59]OGX49764.1 MAG: lipoprotein ABC transporter ATP-binding protein [Omnitrophica WOR_2 bacterium RIFOXYA2_FULL_38_17]OGX54103.1 MAG: lipoprotein ABC transporter ATP-binding protein [Omnitrophica WOR_2 bacterium RIFOXYA12_FULL_38_10]OGX55648.1 MAG: lipoprotein ABC transporter ATP-binding protein [Omni